MCINKRMVQEPIFRNDYFLFGLVFINKKVTKPSFFFKKNQNRFKLTGFDSVRFNFLGQKPVQTGLARFFPVFFRFRLIKPKPNRSVF